MNLRYLWRSVASVLVLSFALFPTLCYASEMETETTTEAAITSDVPMFMSINPSEVTNGYLNVSLYLEGHNSSGSSTYLNSSSYQFLPPFTKTITLSDSSIFTSNNNYLAIGLDFSRSDRANIIDENSSFDVSFGGLTGTVTGRYTWSVVNLGGGGSSITENLEVGSIYGAHLYCFADPNDVWKEFTTYDISDDIIVNGYNVGIDVSSLDVSHDVKKMRIVFLFTDWLDYINSDKCHDGFKDWTGATYNISFDNSTLSLNIDDGSKGLLNGIIEWLRSIRDGITSVKDGVTNVVNGITQLPSKLWTAIENGLKGLFVPSEQDMVAYKDKWDTLLSERFGVVYQSGTIITDTLGTITEQSAQGTINLPETTISFAETDFTFGGYDVPVVPQGFEWLVEIIKGLIDIVVTVAFINAMRTKYDQLMRG